MEKKNKKELVNECVKLFKEGDNFKFVHVRDLRKFVKKYIDPSVSSKSNKPELVEKAMQYLNEETVFQFFQLNRFGLLNHQIKEVLDIDDYMLKKMVNNDQISILASIVYDSWLHGKRKMNIYSFEDVINAVIPDIRQVIIPEMNDKNIEDAIYLVNKSAKVSRDTKENSYKRGKHKQVKSSKTRSNNLYKLKDRALTKRLEEGKLEYIGIHKQITDYGECYLDFYKGEYHTFHIPCNIDSSKEILGEITGEIPAEKTIEVDITFEQAVKLLKEYIK